MRDNWRSRRIGAREDVTASNTQDNTTVDDETLPSIQHRLNTHRPRNG